MGVTCETRDEPQLEQEPESVQAKMKLSSSQTELKQRQSQFRNSQQTVLTNNFMSSGKTQTIQPPQTIKSRVQTGRPAGSVD